MILYQQHSICFGIYSIQVYEYVTHLFYFRWYLWFRFYMLTGFHGLHVIMELFLLCSIYSSNKNHLFSQVIQALRLGLVLAFCRRRMVTSFYHCLCLWQQSFINCYLCPFYTNSLNNNLYNNFLFYEYKKLLYKYYTK